MNDEMFGNPFGIIVIIIHGHCFRLLSPVEADSGSSKKQESRRLLFFNNSQEILENPTPILSPFPFQCFSAFSLFPNH
jgi:hypothetical protein